MRYFNLNALDDAHFELVALVAREYFHADNASAFAVRHGQRSVFNVSCFFAENRPEKSLFRGEFRFALGRNFADEDISRFNFRPDANDSFFVEIF